MVSFEGTHMRINYNRLPFHQNWERSLMLNSDACCPLQTWWRCPVVWHPIYFPAQKEPQNYQIQFDKKKRSELHFSFLKRNKANRFRLVSMILALNMRLFKIRCVLKTIKMSWLLKPKQNKAPNEQNVSFLNMIIDLSQQWLSSRQLDCAKWPTRQLTAFVLR